MRALTAVVTSPASSPTQVIKAVETLSRINKTALLAAQAAREEALRSGEVKPTDPLRVELADGDGALGWLKRHTDPISEVEPYHPPEWVAMTEFLVRRRLKLSPADVRFVDDLLNRSDPIATRCAGSAVPTQPPTAAETAWLSALFWAEGGTEAYLDAPGEA